jgi:two-component system sensor histidine kinase RpfC
VVTVRRRLSVLVADDDAVSLTLTGRILERAGHGHVLVRDGEAALDALVQARYDLAILDINMPGIDGLEVARIHRAMTLARSAPATRFVALTADATPDALARSEEAGMARCIAKPVRAHVLLELIDQAMATTDAAPEALAACRLEETPTDDPVIDIHQVARLRELDPSDAFLDGLLSLFARDAEAALARLDRAVAHGDLADAKQALHQIASAGSNLGAKRLSALCNCLSRQDPNILSRSGPDWTHDVRLAVRDFQHEAGTIPHTSSP